jgi:hypothetical protein
VYALTGRSKALAGPLGCGSDRTQNIQFGTTQASRLSDQVAAHSSGYRAMAVGQPLSLSVTETLARRVPYRRLGVMC